MSAQAVSSGKSTRPHYLYGLTLSYVSDVTLDIFPGGLSMT